MEDFAAFVGLSRPTVSKFFKDPELVRATSRLRIEAAIEASGFTPSLLASNLKRDRTRILGIIVPTTIDPFYMELVRCLEEIANRLGYFAFALSSNGETQLESEAISRLESLNIAGAIVIPVGASHRGGNARLNALEKRCPVVYVDNLPYQGASLVGTDNTQSIGVMVEYLCQTGHPPCFLPMPYINQNAFDRLAAYEDAMAKVREPARILEASDANSWDFEKYGHESAMQLSRQGMVGNTILCANDRIALGVLLAAWETGLSVGRGEEADLRVAGHDDHPFSRYACPPLTTVSQDVSQIARQAMNRLMATLESSVEGGGCPLTGVSLLPGKLVVRDSA
ncbi:LacI family transcriptional regulator [Halomonas sp. SF2003]|nr:LacI family transcriptional regulator [Halomonas sp. SF2003]